jgi:hypothetical protein
MFQIDTNMIVTELVKSVELFKPETVLLITFLVGIIAELV